MVDLRQTPVGAPDFVRRRPASEAEDPIRIELGRHATKDARTDRNLSLRHPRRPAPPSRAMM
jgi:hypothetical protein